MLNHMVLHISSYLPTKHTSLQGICSARSFLVISCNMAFSFENEERTEHRPSYAFLFCYFISTVVRA